MRVSRYGTWQSPITPELVTQATTGYDMLRADGDAVFWLEYRPRQNGRTTLVRWTAEAGRTDVTAPEADVGSRVHEYGGGAYAVSDGTIVYSEREKSAVWTIEPGRPARALSLTADCRYADFAIDPRTSCVYAVREDHRDTTGAAAITTIVVFPLHPSGALRGERVVVEGADFYASPRVAPAGDRLAWIEWDHPNMPWDDTRLAVAPLGAPGERLTAYELVGGPGEAITSLAWAPDGTLAFVSDRTNFWNVYTTGRSGVRATHVMPHDVGKPPWVFGSQPFWFLPDGRYVLMYVVDARGYAGIVDGSALEALPIGPVRGCPVPFGRGIAYITAPVDAPPEIRVLADGGGDETTPVTISLSTAPPIPVASISIARSLAVPTGNGETCYALFYAPKNAEQEAPGDTLPPLIVTSHGGPTSMDTDEFDLRTQWWTTRGFAVVKVNYRGSSGFGRAYRKRLAGEWGVVDVEDCAAVARYLSERGLVDAERIAIRGGSASGFTALAALAGSRTFKAAASLYGVMDLALLAAETHKFESRYTDGLIGPWPAARAIYDARSPLRNAARIAAPVILFQGLDDRVVPPNQATEMVAALETHGASVEYRAYAGEGHGFRKPETVRDVLERELAFYRRVFGLDT